MADQVYTVLQALDKAKKYCSYQERCQMEVRQKLRSFQLTSEQREEVISELIQQNFLNEERFSQAFSRGKFRMKNWGKKKITLALRQKDISEYCINKGLLEIEDTEYENVLTTVVEKAYNKYEGIQNYQRVSKAAQYVIGRGFEPQLVWEKLKTFSND
jgi:regulatory protein